MDIFDLFSFIGGLCLFMFGMNIMSKALEQKAGHKLKSLVSKITSNRFLGLLTGLGITVVIQSSSATTVMVVGFVNSGIMSLNQAIHVIMGANIGTTITAWILSLAGISSSNIFIQLLKPSSFSPILALVGIVFYMFFKSDKKKTTGLILLGFSTLMFGMETMSSSVEYLKEYDWFRNLFIMFENNPFLGVLVGALVTAIIQSSSASIGILQAFATTGQITFGAAIPIILGQNIGTCITAMLSSIGTNRNAKRASLIHLIFNIMGTIIALIIYLFVGYVIRPQILFAPATLIGIALIHSVFNIGCGIILFPFSNLLAKIVVKILPDKNVEVNSELDIRFLDTPTLALEQVKEKMMDMVNYTQEALLNSINLINDNDESKIIKAEAKTDHYEDLIGSYLIKLSSKEINDDEAKYIGLYLKIIGDLERIGDHSLNILKLKKEAKDTEAMFSIDATKSLETCYRAIKEIWELTASSFEKQSYEEALKIEPLEQVIDILVKKAKDEHIKRMQSNKCDAYKGYLFIELLINIERISDHCSNIAGYIIDGHKDNMESHKNIINYRTYKEFKSLYESYVNKYIS